jgi:hypothetical protein
VSRRIALAAALALAAGCTETVEVAIRVEVTPGANGCPDSLGLIMFPFEHSIHLHVLAVDSDTVEVLAADCTDIATDPGRDITALPGVLAEVIDVGPLEPVGRLVSFELVVYHEPVTFCEPFAADRAVVQLFGRANAVLDSDLEVVELPIECVAQ